MLLKEIESQVERWMDSKSNELKKQQESLKQETDLQIQNMKAAYSQQAAAEQEMLRAERERINRENDARVQRVEEIQQAVTTTKKEIAEVLRQQKSVTEQERKALSEREAAINSEKQEIQRAIAETRDEIQRTLKKKADARRIEELGEEVDDIKRGQSASRLIPMILSIGAITLLIATVVAGILIMKGMNEKLADNQETMDSMQATIEELSITPEPTPTPTPVPEPTEESMPTPTPDPVAEILGESIPGVLDWEESESRLPIENAEILRSYQRDHIFVNIIADESALINVEELFKQSGFDYAVRTTKPNEEPTQDASAEPTSEQTEEPTQDASAEPTSEQTEEQTQDASVEPTPEPTEEPLQTKDPRCVVLETVRIEQYLLVFYVQQKEARDVDYRDAIRTIEEQLNGQKERQKFITAYKNGGYGTIVDKAWNDRIIYPIPAEFVPEDLIKFVYDETVTTGIWMYHYETNHFAYITRNIGWEKSDFDAYVRKLQEAVNNGDLLGEVVSNEDDQVVVFFSEEGNAWYDGVMITGISSPQKDN